MQNFCRSTKLSQSSVQLFLQRGQNLGHDGFGVRIGEGTVVRPQLQREGHALLALGNAGAAVDVEQLHIPQQLSGSGGDDGFRLCDGDILRADKAQVTGHGGILGQGGIGGVGQLHLKQLGEVDLGAVDVGVDAVVRGRQRMHLTHHAHVHAVDAHLGAAAGMVAGVVLHGGVVRFLQPQTGEDGFQLALQDSYFTRDDQFSALNLSFDILFLEEDELLAVLQARMLREQTPPFSFSYEYGEQGKPQIVNFPKKFNLSHSGDYVVCGVSDGEVGVDIQKWVPFKDRTAERFFAKAEWKLLQETDVEKRTELFYRLWSRKEAYGKYTGQGIGSVVGEDFSDERRWKEKKICFREQILEAGYSLAVCYGTAEVLNSRKTGNSKT